ncbi:flagellar hook capping FlgD N-terminal domain-containing protein [Paenibacillus humicola]|uniref:flagellar hook capping FlgD N-terminal domain-containing protein n=1 Tax=Paenibacillus humicola TaxID=3110540 RepID=UPI00237A12FD|nr:flagellar hook capping FlgD N-terminal domain-containing protein [Paenibacillus humicola]
MAGEGISTQNVWPYYAAGNVQAAAAKPKDTSLGKDDFLKILVTQLKNQDPMQPLDDKDFVAQMAQFTSVEQLMNMSDEMTRLRQNLGMASSMIGKTIEWNDVSDGGEPVLKSGQVDSILIKDGAEYAKVGGTDVNLDEIVSIADGGDAANGNE